MVRHKSTLTPFNHLPVLNIACSSIFQGFKVRMTRQYFPRLSCYPSSRYSGVCFLPTSLFVVRFKFTEILSCSVLSYGDTPPYPFLLINELLALFCICLTAPFTVSELPHFFCFYPLFSTPSSLVPVILELTAGIALSYDFIIKFCQFSNGTHKHFKIYAKFTKIFLHCSFRYLCCAIAVSSDFTYRNVN